METRPLDGSGGGHRAFAAADRGAGERRAQAQCGTLPDQTATGVAVQIATTPAGASIRVNGEAKCTSDCTLTLPPGAYQITAFLDGYEPAASGVNLVPGRPETLNLPLEARPQTVRILSDLAKGKVVLDGQPPADLQDGQYLFEKVPPGSHTVSVTGSNAEASFSFDLAPARLPAVSGPVNTKNMLAMLVSSFAGHGRLVTSSGPWKLAVNGQPEDDAGPAGVDMKNFQAGLDEMTISQDKDQRAFKEDFGPGPALTVVPQDRPQRGHADRIHRGKHRARVPEQQGVSAPHPERPVADSDHRDGGGARCRRPALKILRPKPRW